MRAKLSVPAKREFEDFASRDKAPLIRGHVGIAAEVALEMLDTRIILPSSLAIKISRISKNTAARTTYFQPSKIYLSGELITTLSIYWHRFGSSKSIAGLIAHELSHLSDYRNLQIRDSVGHTIISEGKAEHTGVFVGKNDYASEFFVAGVEQEEAEAFYTQSHNNLERSVLKRKIIDPWVGRGGCASDCSNLSPYTMGYSIVNDALLHSGERTVFDIHHLDPVTIMNMARAYRGVEPIRGFGGWLRSA
ncbi:MAG TPA: DUF2268 domain-containing putative Zn-dependent protease [Candidatus Saccharibacteria bacterium]|nr:DUF2268 domain-containing putative Zn-dependent protease [Candidatus Saccharibacteria bacterium]HMT55300.1 DUF2268 domain-containing putative Zn-dependent protease [Candidatus Saccharibacteria bacterium]